jgi:biotin transport system substrate-specific component
MTTAPSATLLHTLTARDAAGSPLSIRIASVLFFTALTAAAAQVSFALPFTQVPFTFQPTVVLLSGLVLGSRLACASQILYLLAGLTGLPVFAASVTLPPGALRLLGPTGGYLMAYPIAAFATGYLAERGFDRRYLTSILAMLAGLVIIYASGTLWLGLFARTLSGTAAVGLNAAFFAGVYPFLIPDLIKLAAAAGIVPGVWRLIPPPAAGR